MCVRSNVNVGNSVPRPGKTGKIMDLYILTISFLVEDECSVLSSNMHILVV